jgi:hypothetical protein
MFHVEHSRQAALRPLALKSALAFIRANPRKSVVAPTAFHME